LQKGIQNTSLAEIAKSIKISKGTLYYYYPSKNSLIEEIAKKNFEEAAERIKESLHKTTAKKMKDIFAISVKALTLEPQNAKILHFIFLEILQGDRKLGFKILKIYQIIKLTISDTLLPFCKDREEADRITGVVLALSEGINLGNMLGTNEVVTEEAIKFFNSVIQ
jgi:AcrR family transcriptional regulator